MTTPVSAPRFWRRERRALWHALLVGVLCIVNSFTSNGCESADGGDSGGGQPPNPPRFAVGTSAYEWRDAERFELYTQVPDDVRRVPARAWYPAQPSAVDRGPYFLNPLQAELTAQSNGLPPDSFSRLQLPARVDAPLAQGRRRFPVLIFSPGMSTPPELYGFQLAELASHGYVVFALAHPYATGNIVFADGSIAPELPEPDSSVRDASVATWSLDQRFVLSRVAELARSGSGDRMAGKLDLAHVGVFGHSRGGAAAAQSCLEDGRFHACADLDGSVSSSVMTSSISQPFLLMRSELIESTLESFFANLSGPAHSIQVAGAGHNSFSDLPRLVRDLQLAIDPESWLLGSLDADRAFEINAVYLAAFFAAHLRGAGDEWFFEPSPFAEVEVIHGGSAAGR
jgi:hypothetical protein